VEIISIFITKPFLTRAAVQANTTYLIVNPNGVFRRVSFCVEIHNPERQTEKNEPPNKE
jgi:hypothetical protein